MKILKIRIVFLALAFFRGICLSRHQRIWNQHNQRFLVTHIDIFKKKNFWVIIALFAYFLHTFCKCEKKLYIFKHFAKNKKLFFCQYLSFSVWFPLSLKHWSPLMDVQGVSISTASSMDMHGVTLSEASSGDVQSVSISTTSRMDLQGVSLSTGMDVQGVFLPPPTVWMCWVYPFPQPAV